ncbi:MAG: hypothetical protein K0R57_1961 [Paenibacillaceae bacterium]|jgi:hypothetical protein|nr:hypothetical protein [Paenibacillaceae bacterium]
MKGRNGRLGKLLLTAVLLLGMLWPLIPADSAYAANTTYYVDDTNGLDTNSGTSTGAAWKTLGKVNSVTLQPGDKVLFKSGGIWTGTLSPKGSGTAASRITIDKYASGANPVVNGNGAAQAVLIKNMEYVTVQNLEITNDSATIAKRSGVFVLGQNAGTLNGIYLRNLNIHDVKGWSDRTNQDNFYGNAGIFVTVWTGGDNTNLSRFNDLRIENNNIHDISTGGIYFGGASAHLSDTTGNSWYTNVAIRSNIVNKTGADGIVAGVSKSPVIERNTVLDAGINGTNHQWIAGMWSWACMDPVFQYNEVARTHYDIQSTSDSMAFDTDVFSRGTHIFQYNYSHSNKGGFFMSTKELGVNGGNNVVRYNISQNDSHYHWSDNTISSLTGATSFYNNVFFNNTTQGFKIDGVRSSGLSFKNNIFYVNNGPAALPSNHTYSHNLYYGFTPPAGDANGIAADPQFVNPGTGSDGRATADGYRLKAASPAVNSGTVIASPGTADFWGNPLFAGAPDIGAHERP